MHPFMRDINGNPFPELPWGRIAGRWPGNETDEKINELLGIETERRIVKLKPEARFWDVRLSYPSTRTMKQPDGTVKEYPYRNNEHLMIAAESAQKVIDIVMQYRPDAAIHQINHRGYECAILIQPELMG